MSTDSMNPTTDDFMALFEGSASSQTMIEGRIIPATVIAIENDVVLVDVGLKTEGRIPLKEFFLDDNQPETNKIVEVYLERIENALGEAVLSREKARREESWVRLEEMHNKEEPVTGAIVGRVKGGFTVDLGGVNAFLPGSQVDIRPVRDVGPLMGEKQPFAILKMDRPRGNVVVSRRAVLEESRAEQRAEIVGHMVEGAEAYHACWDAFCASAVSSTSMKQLDSDPWGGVEAKYIIGTRLEGQITNITDYGAFVELEDGVEGLIHVSEMSWTKKNVHPGKIVSTSQTVEVEVLDVDSEKRRISLGLKQTMDNPWNAFLAESPIGSEIEGEVRGVTEFGLFVGLGPDLDGMVHINDIAWDKSGEEAIQAYNKGDMVKAKVLDVDTDKERISLGIKQLSGDPLGGSGADASSGASGGIARNSIVTCTVTETASGGIEVEFGEPAMRSFIRRSDLSRDRSEQRPERFSVGDKVDARVISIDRNTRRVTLSIKALEIAEEKEAVAQYGSADSGASLGDILGAALGSAIPAATEEAPAKAEPAPAADPAPAPKAKAVADTAAMDDRGRLTGPQGEADDLKQIKGVGPVLEGKLNAAGIYHFWQVAALKGDQIAALEEEMSFPGRVERDDWIKQAKELAG